VSEFFCTEHQSGISGGCRFCFEKLESFAREAVERAKRIVALADSFGDIPMPQSTFLCAIEAKQILSKSAEILGDPK
jgi:hypothetical protein